MSQRNSKESAHEFAIEARHLTKLFGDRRAVDGINFEVFRGETFGLLGPNGAGKSTTMRMIACRSPLNSGELRVENLDVEKNARQIRSIIGVVPQENNLDPDLNVIENLLVTASYYRISQPLARERSLELLDFIRLGSRTTAKIHELSGGMKRRLMIARALLHRPRLLLLDEPTTGLDPNVRQEIWEKLEELRRTENLTILLSTHYMDEAEKLCHRLIVMSLGKIVAAGEPQKLIQEKAGRYVLEIRNAANLNLRETAPNIRTMERGTVHFYFAQSTEELTPLMKSYDSNLMFLRPSNLEDVFLQLTVDEER